jgi:hypothetical protein
VGPSRGNQTVVHVCVRPGCVDRKVGQGRCRQAEFHTAPQRQGRESGTGLQWLINSKPQGSTVGVGRRQKRASRRNCRATVRCAADSPPPCSPSELLTSTALRPRSASAWDPRPSNCSPLRPPRAVVAPLCVVAKPPEEHHWLRRGRTLRLWCFPWNPAFPAKSPMQLFVQDFSATVLSAAKRQGRRRQLQRRASICMR